MGNQVCFLFVALWCRAWCVWVQDDGDESKDSVKKLADAIVEAKDKDKTARDKPLGLHAWVASFTVYFPFALGCVVYLLCVR